MARPWKPRQRTETLGATERPMGVSYGLIGAILLLGGAGYLLDMLLGTGPWMLVGGLLLGVVIGFLELGKLISS